MYEYKYRYFYLIYWLVVTTVEETCHALHYYPLSIIKYVYWLVKYALLQRRNTHSFRILNLHADILGKKFKSIFGECFKIHVARSVIMRYLFCFGCIVKCIVILILRLYLGEFGWIHGFACLCFQGVGIQFLVGRFLGIIFRKTVSCFPDVQLANFE